MAKKKVFLDSNILFSIIYNDSPHSQLQLFTILQKEKIIDLIISELVVKETYHNIKKKISTKISKLEETLSFFKIVEDNFNFVKEIEDSLPYNDKVILNTAIVYGSDYFITGNTKDFVKFYGNLYKNCMVLKPSDFFRLNK